MPEPSPLTQFGELRPRPLVVRLLYSRPQAPIDQGAEMRAAFMSIEKAFAPYSEGMTLASQNAGLGDPGACRRR
jgi:hypothetical protein